MIERLENPVFRQSSRQRMRGVRTYGCLLAYLLTLALVVVIAYVQFTDLMYQRTTTGLAQMLFESLTLTQWFLVALITPALTTSSISMEREQRTIDLLIMTPMSRFAIVWGKFTSALAFVVVMILCGLPLVAVLFLLGGVDLSAVAVRFVGMLMTGAVLCAFGVMMSTVSSSSTMANILTYGILTVVYVLGAIFSTATVMSRAFGGGGAAFTISTFPGWQLWGYVGVLVVLVIMLLLQIAANYLLPDPRVAAWKTRLWTSLIFVWWMLGTVWTASSIPTVPTRNGIALIAMYLLIPIAVAWATGVPMTGRQWYQWLSPRALSVGTVQTALPYLLLLLLFAFICDRFAPKAYQAGGLVWTYCAGYLWWLWSAGYVLSRLTRSRVASAIALLGIFGVGTNIVITAYVALDREDLLVWMNLFVPAWFFDSGQPISHMVEWSVIYSLLALAVCVGANKLRLVGGEG